MDNNFNNGLNGFDSATPFNEVKKTEDVAPTLDNTETPCEKPSTEETDTSDKGYVVTPKGGYYEERRQSGFFPSGSYEEEPKPIEPIPATFYDPKIANTPPQKEPKTPKEKKQGRFGLSALIATALIAALVSSGCFYVFNNMDKPISDNQNTVSTQTEQKIIKIDGSIEQLAEAASKAAMDSVVGVQTTYAVQSFFSGQSTTSGSGSGVIYKSDGYIITNYHVIADTIDSANSSIRVFLNNDTEKGYEAEVINYNISCDLAVLKIDKTGLNAIKIADSNELSVGQFAVAIGSPGGLEFIGSTTFGIISGLDRQIATTDGNMKLIQTDAAINPGNSGGALVNTKGELIGISSSKLVSEGYEGMGFAIPVNTVKEICDNLIAHEGEGDPYTGISVSYNYTSRVLEFYGYPNGAVVASVDEGSPAQTAGIRRGDIITKFGDTTVTEYSDYENALRDYYKGDKVSVSYYRSGKIQTTTIIIGAGN